LNIRSILEGTFNTKYRGVETLKSPFDYVMYQMIISDLKPDLIIEIGTNCGGSSLYLADLLEINGKGIIHTVDIVDQVKSDLVKQHPRIERFLGGYLQYDTSITSNFERILVIDDGSHKYEDVIQAMNIFKNIVSVDSFMIIEDGSLSWMGWEERYNGGPLKAINEFISLNENYEIDRKWCDFYGKNVTLNPNGFLKRIK
jgi:cephalosporin hydroxylase